MAIKNRSIHRKTININAIANLAGLPLTKLEETLLSGQIDVTVNYVSQLQQLDTSGKDETVRVTEVENVLREDVIDTSRILSQDEALANAKRSHDGFFVADRVLEDKS